MNSPAIQSVDRIQQFIENRNRIKDIQTGLKCIQRSSQDVDKIFK